MKLQKILERLQKLHPKEIDLSLGRIRNLCKKLGNPQKNLNSISVVGTNGKNSTIQTMRAILSTAKIKCNIYTSPHVTKINERFVYNNKEINDEELYNILCEVEEANNGDQITYFEILTAGFFHGTKKHKDNINIIESGLFHRFDATNILEENIASVVTAIVFLVWGYFVPKFSKNVNDAIRLLKIGAPINLFVLIIIIYLGSKAGSIHWALFIVSSIFLSLTQPAVGMAFSLSNAGKALTSFNLLIFIGAFFIQWIIGLIIDAGIAFNLSEIDSFKLAMTFVLITSLLSYLFFLRKVKIN